MSEIKLTIKGEGISFEKAITEHRAGQIISLLSTELSPLIDPITKPNVSSNSFTAGRGGSPEVKNLPTDASLEGFPGYYDLPTKADKILWLLAYADQNQIKGLASGDVDYLSSQLKDRIPTKNFGVFNERNLRSGYIRREGRIFCIQKKGIDYLHNLVK